MSYWLQWKCYDSIDKCQPIQDWDPSHYCDQREDRERETEPLIHAGKKDHVCMVHMGSSAQVQENGGD